MAAPSADSSSSAQPQRRPWVLLVFAAVLFVGSTIVAYRQEPRPNPLQPVSTLSFDWWRYPIERNAFKRLPVITANLHAVSVIAGTDQVWAVGDGGMIVHSNDGGRTWEQRTIVLNTNVPQEQPTRPAPAKGAFLGLPALIPNAHADRGESPAQQAPQYQEPPQENAPLKEEPVQQQQPPEQSKETPPSSANEPAVAAPPVSTQPNQQTKDPSPSQNPPPSGEPPVIRLPRSETEDFRGLQFINEQEGWIVGSGGAILHTSDNGQTWTPQYGPTVSSYNRSGRLFQGPTTTNFHALHIANDGRRGWIVGDNGTILFTSDGGQIWMSQDSGVREDLVSVHIQEGEKHGWIAGADGTVLHSVDEGQTWKPQADGSLPQFYLEDDQRNWAVNDDGTVIHTTNGGQTWLPQSRRKRSEAEEASLYTIAFAPWYYPVGWLLPLLFLFVASRRHEDPISEEQESVADHLVSDRPLEAGDPDPLGFGAIARGLSRFLRNEKTQPPLTIAVTGEWGTGKSSLMNLLKADLERYGFRPVWFNAWHHQQEDQLLAALLENIRSHSIPPLWHLAGWGFRARLLWLRGWRNWSAWFLLFVVVAFSLGYFYAHPQTAGQAIQQLRSWAEALAPGSKGTGTSAGTDTGSLFTLLGSAFVSFLALKKGLTAFGVDPAVLLSSASEGAKVRDLGAQASFRHKFAQQFRDVTRALHPRTMLILIDDLDRCSPDKVLQALEAINFLVSSGECYVVMGMAMERVERCVGLGFKDVAEELLDERLLEPAHPEKKEEGKRKRTAFARQYLEKLINIEVPVPTPSDKQTEQLLIAASPPAPAKQRWPWHQTVGRARLGAVAPWLVSGVCLLLLASSFWLGQTFDKPEESPQSNAPATKQGAPAQTKTEAPPTAPGNLVVEEDKRPIGSGEFIPGQQSQYPTWPLLFPLVVVLVSGLWLVWRNRPTIIVNDSPEFADALRIWLPVITTRQNTPRSVKRFVNKVRYLAMRQRPVTAIESPDAGFLAQLSHTFGFAPRNGSLPSAQLGIPESLLVALSAVQHHSPVWTGTNGSITEKIEALGEVVADQENVEGARPADLAREAATINKAWVAHEARFHNTGIGDTYWNTFAEMSEGVRVQS